MILLARAAIGVVMKSSICKFCQREFIWKTYAQKQFCTRECYITWTNKEKREKPCDFSGTEICRHCNETKPKTEFVLRYTGDGVIRNVTNTCMRCFSFYQSVRWNKRKVEAIKHLGGRCKRCTKRVHPINFEFHHRDPAAKEFTWIKLRLKSWSNITKELDKCDLLCVFCHRRLHNNPKVWEFLKDDDLYKQEENERRLIELHQ